jgi:hypothetical protein
MSDQIPTASKSRINTAICALFAASATKLKSRRKGDVAFVQALAVVLVGFVVRMWGLIRMIAYLLRRRRRSTRAGWIWRARGGRVKREVLPF